MKYTTFDFWTTAPLIFILFFFVMDLAFPFSVGVSIVAAVLFNMYENLIKLYNLKVKYLEKMTDKLEREEMK